MTRIAWMGLCLAAWQGLAGPAAAQECRDNAARAAAHFAGMTLAEGTRHAYPVGPGWRLAFEPTDHGWQLRLYDGADPAVARDLSSVTPPFRGAPNPRDIFGWHFRNAANDGPNTGDVNAPQHLRQFFFSTAPSGTGGFKPAPDGPAHPPPDPQDGRGWLRLTDMTLSPPAPGERAAMRHARLDLCLTWPRDAAQDPAAFAPEDIEVLGACGLDLGRWQPVAPVLPRLLGGDFDGDGALDEAVRLRDRATGAAALAICRAGTWLSVLAGAPLPGDLLPRIEAWRVLPPGHGPLGYVDEPPWPGADGDLIVLERHEKSLHLLYRADGAWQAQQVFRLMTQE